MRSGTSRGPFFLKEWLPADPKLRDLALIGAIGASDPLQLDGLGGNSTLNSKVAIVSRSSLPDCDLDYCSPKWASVKPLSMSGPIAAICCLA